MYKHIGNNKSAQHAYVYEYLGRCLLLYTHLYIYSYTAINGHNKYISSHFTKRMLTL